jgi:hypothetical protein
VILVTSNAEAVDMLRKQTGRLSFKHDGERYILTSVRKVLGITTLHFEKTRCIDDSYRDGRR